MAPLHVHHHSSFRGPRPPRLSQHARSVIGKDWRNCMVLHICFDAASRPIQRQQPGKGSSSPRQLAPRLPQQRRRPANPGGYTRRSGPLRSRVRASVRQHALHTAGPPPLHLEAEASARGPAAAPLRVPPPRRSMSRATGSLSVLRRRSCTTATNSASIGALQALAQCTHSFIITWVQRFRLGCHHHHVLHPDCLLIHSHNSATLQEFWVCY